jgi:hypothetical protein
MILSGVQDKHTISSYSSWDGHFRPLIPWVNILRKRVFPDGKTREKEVQELYLEGIEGNNGGRVFSLGVREVRAVNYYDFPCLVSIAIHPPSTIHNLMPSGTVESQGGSLQDAFNPWSARCSLNFVVMGSLWVLYSGH